MAVTITGTQVQFPAGTFEGYYTGSSSTNTSFPLGSYLVMADPAGPDMIRNQTVSSIGYNTANSYAYTNRLARVSLAGTWSFKGNGYTNAPCCAGIAFSLVVRVA